MSRLMIVMVKVITKTIWIKIMRYELMIMNIDVGDTNTDNYDDMNDNKKDNRHTDRDREKGRGRRERKKK